MRGCSAWSLRPATGSTVKLEDLGWTADRDAELADHRERWPDALVGRMARCESNAVLLWTDKGVVSAVLPSRLRGPEARPAVGDWVVATVRAEQARVAAILARHTSFVRRAGHQPAEPEPVPVAELEPIAAGVEVQIPDTPEKPSEPEPPLAPGQRRVEVEIVDEGPIGCGNCTSKPFEVAPTDGAGRFCVLYQECEGDPPLPPRPVPPDGLDAGGRYQLTLRKGGEDFGETPELLASLMGCTAKAEDEGEGEGTKAEAEPEAAAEPLPENLEAQVVEYLEQHGRNWASFGFHGVVLVARGDGVAMHRAFGTADLPNELMGMAYGAEAPTYEEHREVPVPLVEQANTAGHYFITRKTEKLIEAVDPERLDSIAEVDVVVLEGEYLALDVPVHGRKRMHPLGKGRFFFKDLPRTTARFTRKSDGEGRLVLEQPGGAELVFVRKGPPAPLPATVAAR